MRTPGASRTYRVLHVAKPSYFLTTMVRPTGRVLRVANPSYFITTMVRRPFTLGRRVVFVRDHGPKAPDRQQLDNRDHGREAPIDGRVAPVAGAKRLMGREAPRWRSSHYKI